MSCTHQFIEPLEPRQHLAGTLVKDIIRADGTIQPCNFTELNGLLYFTADDGTGGALWRSDGTAAGTYVVQPLSFEVGSYFLLTAVGNSLYYAGNNSASSHQIWKTDGSPGGAVLLKQFDATLWIDPDFTGVGSTVFFTFGPELWKTDGTPEGTMLVKGWPSLGLFQPKLTAYNGRLLFSAYDGIHGQELWSSDGTPEGTVLLRDLAPGGSSNPRAFATMNGWAYFFADIGALNRGLWKTDGTPQGTSMLKAFGYVRDAEPPSVLDGKVYFAAASSVSGTPTLWQSDGTAAGTLPAVGFPFEVGGGLWRGTHAWNGRIVFEALARPTDLSRPALYAFDPATGDLRTIAEFARQITPLDTRSDHISFVAYDELWRSDGTTEGTACIAIVAGLDWIEINGSTYFAGFDADGRPDLFKTDTADYIAATTGPSFVVASARWNGQDLESFVQPFDADTLSPRVGFTALPGISGEAAATPIARADFNADGTDDIVVGAPMGTVPILQILDGRDFSLLNEFYAFDQRYLGGLNLATGDVNGDGRPDLLVSAGPGAGPHVKVFNGATLLQPSPAELASFWAFDPRFLGGVRVAAGDFDADGRTDVIAAAGPGAGPHAKVFSGQSLIAAPSLPTELASFWTDDPANPAGVNLAAGDFDADGRSDVVAGVGKQVAIFAAASFAAAASPPPFRAFAAYSGSEVVTETRPAVFDLDGDGRLEILTGPGPMQGTLLRAFDDTDFAPLPTPDLLFAWDNDLRLAT